MGKKPGPKRIYNIVRTDTFESEIAHYTAKGDYESADAIRRLAVKSGAPIDEEKIAADAEARRKVYYS